MKYTVYGPGRDGEFVCWMVYGPRGKEYGTFYTKIAALRWVKANS